MARVRTVDFLPEIFQTSTNKQFLGATLDQLVQEPKIKKIQGFVGRRVGPGVNANDKYVVETDPSRADYQLEPGVIFLDPTDNTKIVDAITYPGITDAMALQGANTTKADRLYTSEFYSWDPFIDFDKFTNFSQYYWLPAGPDAVQVFSGGTPSTNNFVVTRENGVYTFSGVAGNNPDITLVRGGSYTFQVAQNQKETENFRVTNNGTSAYVIDYEPNKTLTLVRGNTYVFNLILDGNFPFYIKTQPSTGINNQYTTGVTNNGATQGYVTFTVPQDAPNTLYYANSTESNMHGTMNIINGTPGTGPGFWIQLTPGVSGTLPWAPNISSRLDQVNNGVTNNGEDLGTITFDVPAFDSQEFYYNLAWVNNQTTAYSVDLLTTTLKFNQINNASVVDFLATYGGIDGIQDLNNKTIVIANDIVDPEEGGWQVESQFDPLPPAGNVVSGSGSFDSVSFSQTTDLIQSQRYSVWQIQYITTDDGYQYIQLSSLTQIDDLQKFNIASGTQWSNTQWYKNALGYFVQVPLLAAASDVLYYQDGTDPEIVGRFKIINPDASSTLDITDIIGRKNYTSPNGVVFTNGLKVTFIGSVFPASYQNQSYYVEGVGTAIKLLPVSNYVTPETYTKSASVPYDSTPYDVGNYDASLNQPEVPDYITINRASPDLNPWTRSNRWFHVDVINASAKYNNTVPYLDNKFRGKRPIIEFRAGTQLFDFGTEGKQPVDIIDFTTTDAFSTINGSIGYGVDGYTFLSGSRVIFAADIDPQVRNKIYTVEFITPDSVPPLIAEPVINLVPAADSDVYINQTVVCLSGATLQGKSFWYDGVNWITSQQKTAVNQPPLFDVHDSVGVSFSNKVKYPSSNFYGSKLFSYAQGTGNNDAVLGFPLKYLSLTNVGDIVFDNNLYTDTFIYTKDGTSTTSNISEGFVREYLDRQAYIKEIGWQTAITPSLTRQQFRFSYDGNPLLLDVKVAENNVVPAIQLYVGGQFQELSTYTVQTTATTTSITLLNTFVNGDVIEVDVLSDQASKVAFYTVPDNLTNNPLNVNSPNFTLGTIRTHYESICVNLLLLSGPINGANNTRDLGNIIPYGTNIVQQSSPLTLAGYFMRNQEYNIFNALSYNSREYERFKAQLLDAPTRHDYTNYTIPQMLDSIIEYLNTGRSQSNPFYWSDMLPASSIYTSHQYTVTPISTNVFDLSTTYDFTSSNYKSVLIYINDRLLTIGYDYIIENDAPRVTITATLNVGDVVTINEYSSTVGNFVPNTPTKLGLYPAFKPEIYYDTTYVDPTFIIRGHDGSKTVAFGDFRDELLLEFETRIYNNLKIKSLIPLTASDVIPGQFRKTDYSLSEINNILAPDFLSWVGWNKLNYKSQDYIATNEFTWNYSSAGNKLTGTYNETPLAIGAWRGIYRYFYDTEYPNTRPWEMLGFSEEPSWWQTQYGPAPYTSGNLVLWDDLAAGYVNDPAGGYYRPEYARPNLQEVIPASSEGQLLSPLNSVVGVFDSGQFQKSWTFGDGGPVESSWTSSSSYPFAIMRLLALTRPAEFFALFADRDLYKYNTELSQYLYNDRYRLDANNIQIYGNGVSKASYIDWIVDYNQQTGTNSATNLQDGLSNIDIRLCYRVGSFTDKQYTQIYTEKSSPNSVNSSLLLPPESYNLLLYKNEPFDEVTYSSVIIQIVEGGYAVYGYGLMNPYFDILVSRATGTRTTIDAGGTSVNVPTEYTDTITQVPYGYVFINQTMVVDFLLSYGALLERQGLSFEDQENGRILNWKQMAQEFLYWSNMGWGIGNIINLNPTAMNLYATKEQAIVDSIVAQTADNLLLDQNRRVLPIRDLVVDRFENTFKLMSLSEQTINYVNLRYTNFETMIVLDNVSIFNDLIYNPATGARQNRINVISTVSADWNGQLDAQGFILNNNQNVQKWEPNKKYARGEIVIYKNNYWSAQDIIQPSLNFDYSKWTKSDYTKIQGGLLQNIALKSNQLANSYDVYQANLNNDQDLLSYGLIGFRPRTYMTALNLNDTSQVGVYQQFIKDKGTDQSVRLIGHANLGKEVAQYDIFENWAIQRATYGANANRRFIELRTNQAKLLSNPSTIQVVEPQQNSSADQAILIGDIWRESYKVTNTNIFPTTTDLTINDISLPSAGYVDLDDVDITVFSLLGNLGFAPGVLDTIGIGSTIWAAKSNTYDWNIYRCAPIPGYITEIDSNLNGTSVVTFSKITGLVKNEIIIIRGIGTTVDGAYKVINVVAPNQIVVELNFSGTLSRDGVAFLLETQRVAQKSDVYHLPVVNDLLPGAKVWIDNNGQGLWEVIEKQLPFVSEGSLDITSPSANSFYGTSVAQGRYNIIAMVGAPGYESTGGVYTYVKNDQDQYVQNSILTLDGVTDASGYGNLVAIGDQQWGIASANSSNSNAGYVTIIYRAQGSNSFVQRQLLVAPDEDYGSGAFGTGAVISSDERWIYIGSPGNNKVYAFGRVDVEEQIVTYITTNTFLYNYSNGIQANNENQLFVVLNNKLLTLGVDYTVNASSIALTEFPPVGQKLVITRRTESDYLGDGSTLSFDLSSYLYTVTDDIFSFTVLVDNVLQRPLLDYDLNSGNLVFNTAPTNGSVISVTAKTYFTHVDTLTVSGIGSLAEFGHTIGTSSDGRQLVVGAPNDDSVNVNNSGSVYAFNRNVIRYIISNDSQTVFDLPAGSTGPISVRLNNVFLTDSSQYINGQFTADINALTVTLDNVTLAVGDILEIENNIFSQYQKIVANTPYDGAKFGYVVDYCEDNDEFYSGSPYDSSVLLDAGSVDIQSDQARNYGVITSTIPNPSLTAGDTLNINYMSVAVPAYPNNTVSGLVSAINSAGIPNVVATASNGLITLTVINLAAAQEGDLLTVYPGAIGTAFDDLGFTPWTYSQTITSPNPSVGARFGSSLWMDADYDSLIVGAPAGNTYEPVTFDNGKTYFDDRSTRYSSTVIQSGAVYTYDYFESVNPSVSNPGHFAFGQQVYDNNIESLTQWGTSVNYVTGKLLIGAPGNTNEISNQNYGRVGIFENADKLPAWITIRQQTPVGDVNLINSIYMFDRLESTAAHYLDFINPLQGKILGAAQRNIDYTSPNDPAKYNTGTINNNGNFWAANQVGQIWWDITNTRFIDPSQDDIAYASRRWGQLFPGSHVDVYQWVVSDQPPSLYTGEGTPYNTTSYTVLSRLTNQGTFQTLYYFWVTGISSINSSAGKTLSTVGITRYIEEPRSSGIAYAAILDANTVAIYNVQDYLSASDTILHIEFDQEYNSDNIHTEYELITDGKDDSFLSGNLYRKLLDSFSGENTTGAAVPDPTLSYADRYGVQFRPRQSMFVNRFAALDNYLTRANTIIAQYPIAETKKFNLLNSSDPEPTVASGEWNQRLLNIEELSYQNINAVPLGYKYLIVSDSTQHGYWTIYEVINKGPVRSVQLSRVQTYDTKNYWSYINWYAPTYNSSIIPTDEVPNYAALATLNVPVGSSVKVTANAQNQWEIYLLTATGWTRVGLQDGTIQFDETLWNYTLGKFGFDVEVFDAQYFDQAPNIETRKIIQAINEEIFINEMSFYRNNLLILMFNYIMSEQTNPEWLMKTSLVDVQHKIRQLLPYQIYRQDNQEFVLDYISEVKPYHVQIRDFSLEYNGEDAYPGAITDFDLPAYYDTNLEIPQYVSPVLIPYTQSTAVGTGRPNNDSDTPANSELWQTTPYDYWFNNYTLSLENVTIINGGTGYYSADTTLTVVGNCTVPAEITAITNSAGAIIGVNVINPGSGYLITPTIEISGPGTGAQLYPVMGNQLVRNFKVVMKYDRYQYTSTITDWTANVAYTTGTQVRYDDRVWQATAPSQSSTFIIDYWMLVDADSLSGVDRTQGFYTPTVNEPGLQLPLLINGIDYPGVQVVAPLFNQNTGYDVGNYDINPFDNISYGPEGLPTYDPAILDAIYESSYLDLYLGTRPTDINVNGGAYIDTYESHAPEELVPGAEFDTLDLRVYTRNMTYYVTDGFTTTFAAPAGSAAVTVEFNGVEVDPLEYPYTYTGGNVVFTTAPVDGFELSIAEVGVILEEWRIFQDMRGLQLVYRMTPNTTTRLAQPLLSTDDVVYVEDASVLTQPGLAADFNINITYPSGVTVMYNGLFYQSIKPTVGHLPTDTLYWKPIASAADIWGVITINGERIMYRERDTVNNTVSSLMRGTAGTGAANHDVDSIVYDLGQGNLLYIDYQNYVESTSTLANGVQTTFSSEIELRYNEEQDYDTTPFSSGNVNFAPGSYDYGLGDPTLAVEVYVGGIRQYSGYVVTPSHFAVVQFDQPPPAGQEVTILVRKGHWWYDTAIDPQTLYECNTTPARFLRGEI